jgi:hypothetical protein
MPRITRQATFDECVSAFDDAIAVRGFERDWYAKQSRVDLLKISTAVHEAYNHYHVYRVGLHYWHPCGDRATLGMLVFGSHTAAAYFRNCNRYESGETKPSVDTTPIYAAVCDAESDLNARGLTWMHLHHQVIDASLRWLLVEELDAVVD